MSQDKAYDPKITENKWSAFWEQLALFKANSQSNKPPFSLVIPPPNVTGVLHMGHALVNTLQDVMVRFKRMDGFEALWVPGTDHAGIATQTVVERHLMETLGKRRSDMPREEFLEHVWAWKEKSEKVILHQIKRLGCSCDFSRQHFTMDEDCNRAVRTMFKKLFDAGLIYQGDYLVNWDPVTQTALADDEVEYEEREGFLWTLSYPLEDGAGHIHIATTRPETMFGDTAIAVSAKDPRYQSLIGKYAILPILNRKLPIIADAFVDPEFGTGAVKVTPAHDPNDYKMGLQHQLPMINVMHPNGYLNEQAGPFAGMSREDARQAVVKHLQETGHLVKCTRHTLRVGVSYRSKAVIEPMLSKQWFVKMEPFIHPLQQAVKEKKVQLVPESWQNTYFHWIDHLRDWCISRQLWWGHRIPVWHHVKDPQRLICYDGEGLPPEVKAHPEQWEQDPDVLDTWFSSALWPLSTLGWPDSTADFKKFYPTSILVTGHDILFFWVARMILMAEYATGQVPFQKTFLHGLIYGCSYWRERPGGGIIYVTGEEKRSYDLGTPLAKGVQSKWEKLSKSKGNVIDPLELIEDYGTDAVRMALCSIANQTPQIDLDRRRFEEFKNFANKIWNGARFVLMNLDGLTSEDLQHLDHQQFQLEDRWILSSLGSVIQAVRRALENFQFDQAAEQAYNFFWKEFCAYYVEFSKPTLYGTQLEHKKIKQKILLIVLVNMVRLLHPLAPFITEELFQLIKARFAEGQLSSNPYLCEVQQALLSQACACAPYPKVVCQEDIQDSINAQFAKLEQVIYAIRNIRGEMKIPPHVATDLYLVGPFPAEQVQLLRALIRLAQVHCVAQPPHLTFGATAVVEDLQIYLPLPPELAEQELNRLSKQKAQLEQAIQHIHQLLSNQDFLAKAKPELICKKQAEHATMLKELEAINHRLN
ncbi:MAG: valine--tRNA ligase [Verrucomicrobia bacterium]|nr:valine--tRNA ligase [Verrucomicrobiota bacterium]MBS0645623.1 valine--tRNA ligase [Verrucomicrobiota bacterium]